jgi:hypothetical protein
LWLSLLLLKPQYALLFGIFVLWKRRWSAVIGACVGGAVLIGLGALVCGPESLVRFLEVIRGMSDLRNDIAGSSLMMNWRALVLWIRPDISETAGQLVVWVLSIATMLVSLLVWRGPWEPESDGFGPKFAVLSIGALVGSYHSHPHGAALLIVPLAAAWASPLIGHATRVAIWLAVYAPTFIVVWVTGVVDRLAVSADPDIPLWTVWPKELPGLLFILALTLMLRDVLPRSSTLRRVWARSYA